MKYVVKKARLTSRCNRRDTPSTNGTVFATSFHYAQTLFHSCPPYRAAKLRVRRATGEGWVNERWEEEEKENFSNILLQPKSKQIKQAIDKVIKSSNMI